MKWLLKLYRMLKGFAPEQKKLLPVLKKVLGKEQYKQIKNEIYSAERELLVGLLELPDATITYPKLTGKGSQELNEKLRSSRFSAGFTDFSKNAFSAISLAIAPSIMGMQDVKEATTLQLFADERLHILLLGDPGTGKTEVLRSAMELAEISAMGLGSGTSKAGLSIAYARGELHKGLLVQANKGICCVDELNLMKKDDRAALYNAMEKGFITYDKGGHHDQFDADVRVLATANPKGDRFTSTAVDSLKKQLPFDPALLSRFHFVFLILKPDVEAFTDIARKIARGHKATVTHKEFYQAYIKHANTMKVNFPSNLEPLVTEAAKKIKENEDELLIEVSPRIVKGIIGFAKASARSELRTEVTPEDVQRVLNILGSSLKLSL